MAQHGKRCNQAHCKKVAQVIRAGLDGMVRISEGAGWFILWAGPRCVSQVARIKSSRVLSAYRCLRTEYIFAVLIRETTYPATAPGAYQQAEQLAGGC